MQDCSNYSALAMELLQSCTKPSVFGFTFKTQLRLSFFTEVSCVFLIHLLGYKTCLDTKPVLYQDRFCSLTDVQSFVLSKVLKWWNTTDVGAAIEVMVCYTGLTHAKLVSLTSPCCSGWSAPMNTSQGQQRELSSDGCADFNAWLESDLVLIINFNFTHK